jgi:hypothetical protein
VPDSLNLDSTILSEALALNGAGASALLRHAVAALLSATHPRIAYPLTARQVIDQVNAALAGSATQIDALKNTLDGHNNLGSDGAAARIRPGRQGTDRPRPGPITAASGSSRGQVVDELFANSRSRVSSVHRTRRSGARIRTFALAW